MIYFFELAFDVVKQTQGTRTSLSGPQTSRTPAAPARAPPRPGERGVTVWDGNSPSMLSPGSTTVNAGFKRGWSGSQVRLTRLELTLYRTDHFRPLAPSPSTSPSPESPPGSVRLLRKQLRGLRAAQGVERTAAREQQIGELEFELEERERKYRKYGHWCDSFA